MYQRLNISRKLLTEKDRYLTCLAVTLRELTGEAYRNTVHVYRVGVRKNKDHTELNLAIHMKDNKKGFYRSISNTRKMREYMGQWIL